MTQEKLEEFKRRLQEAIQNPDTDDAHGSADKVLCEMLIELGYQDAVDLWKRVKKWYS